MAGQSQFTKAVEIMQSLPRDGKVKPSGETPLKLHALYQQGSQGDMNTARPGVLDAAGKIRWDTWNELRGTSREDAMDRYVALALEVLEPVAADDAATAAKVDAIKNT
ncbi:acyl-CoA-binding protein [Streptomyces exfoliatus]|uniref:acyl-CoA-binding protein n=1 Tax=Streptomyces exfoliatus TaxID=1905 RepID=UPI0004679D9D|nr:acyl-CoA-binding protein [Streptomyces exfoliatus]